MKLNNLLLNIWLIKISLTKDFDEYKQANNYEFEIEKLLSEKETLCRQLEDAYNCKNRNSELETVLMAAQKSNSDLEEGLLLTVTYCYYCNISKY